METREAKRKTGACETYCTICTKDHSILKMRKSFSIRNYISNRSISWIILVLSVSSLVFLYFTDRSWAISLIPLIMIITAYHALVQFLRYRKLHKYVIIRKQRAPLLVRKNISDKLEQLKPIVTRIGFLIAISSTILAFNWVDKDEIVVEDDHVYTLNEDFEIEPVATVQKKKTQPKPKIVLDPEIDTPIPEKIDTASPEKPSIGDSISLPPEMETNDTIPYYLVEEQPEFPGGDSALIEYLYKSYHYPNQGAEGYVVVKFIINKS